MSTHILLLQVTKRDDGDRRECGYAPLRRNPQHHVQNEYHVFLRALLREGSLHEFKGKHWIRADGTAVPKLLLQWIYSSPVINILRVFIPQPRVTDCADQLFDGAFWNALGRQVCLDFDVHHGSGLVMAA